MKRFYLYIYFITVIFSAEGRYISQNSNDFYNFMLFMTLTSEDEKSPYLPELYRSDVTNFLSVKEGLIIRNEIRNMLEEDDYEED